MRREHIRIAGLQGALTITGFISTYLVVSHLAAWSVAFGGCIALVSTLFLALRLGQAERMQKPAEQSLQHAYRTAAERFVWVFLLFLAGYKVLELAPLWLLTGFVAGQSVWMLAPLWKNR
jgi:hypothetical protein